MCWLFVGSTAIELIPRPRNASLAGVTHVNIALLTQLSPSFVQLWPPFVDL